MPHATTSDGLKLYYEEAGSGTPLLFVHEFAGDYRSWEPQMRFFARRYRCITYSQRGYTPSDVPPAADAYSYEHFRDDVIAVLDHLAVDKAHIVGLSMGGYSTLMAGLKYPQRALSLTLAGAGSGSERWLTEDFRRNSHVTAQEFETRGAVEVAKTYGMGQARVPFLIKDPRGFGEFQQQLAQHSAQGSAHTSRGFQGARPSIYDFEAEMTRLAVPTLIVVGDEDEPCLEPSLFFKQAIPASGLAMFPKTGHVVNLEEPTLFNDTLSDFLARVDAGRWPPRDPRSLRPGAPKLPR
jgi:3-oxoadipate enol-lactonase